MSNVVFLNHNFLNSRFLKCTLLLANKVITLAPINSLHYYFQGVTEVNYAVPQRVGFFKSCLPQKKLVEFSSNFCEKFCENSAQTFRCLT